MGECHTIIKNYILSIDPSCKHSAFTLIDMDSLAIMSMGFLEEKDILNLIGNIQELYGENHIYHLAVETIQNLGCIVGREVFDTCILIGKILERAESTKKYHNIVKIYRSEEKLNLCGTTKTNDVGIKNSLIQRFAKDVPNYGKGTKKSPGWFYGVKADIWQAYAIGITYYDLYILKERYYKKDKK